MNELLATLEDTGQALGVAVAGVFDSASLRAASDTDLLDVLRAASALARQTESLLVEAAGEVAERSSSPDRSARLTSRLQCRNVAEVVTRTTRVSARRAVEWERASAEVRRSTGISSGELLPPQFPALRDALGEGEVTVEGLRAATMPLQDAAARIDTAQRLAADEQLAAAARGAGPEGTPAASPEDLKALSQALCLYLDPDGAEPRAEQALRRRGVTLGKGRDGLVTFSGRLLPEVAAQFQRIVDSILNPRVPEFTPTCDATTVESGTGGDDGDAAPGLAADAAEVRVPMDMSAAWGPPDQRTAAQKRHDAFATALIAAAGSGELPTLGGEAPTLVIVAREDDLLNGQGAGHVSEHDQPVSLAAARQAACIGRVLRVTLDREGRITELLSKKRCFTKKQRAAIAARDGGCIIPGCTVTANWCEVHHVIPAVERGPTHPDNGCLLCYVHHRTLDVTGWQIRMRNGIPEVQAPAWWDATGTWRAATKSPARIRNIIDDQRYPWMDNPDWTPTRPTIEPPTPRIGAWPLRPPSPDTTAPRATPVDDPEFRPWGQPPAALTMKLASDRPKQPPRPVEFRPWGRPPEPPTNADTGAGGLIECRATVEMKLWSEPIGNFTENSDAGLPDGEPGDITDFPAAEAPLLWPDPDLGPRQQRTCSEADLGRDSAELVSSNAEIGAAAVEHEVDEESLGIGARRSQDVDDVVLAVEGDEDVFDRGVEGQLDHGLQLSLHKFRCPCTAERDIEAGIAARAERHAGDQVTDGRSNGSLDRQQVLNDGIELGHVAAFPIAISAMRRAGRARTAQWSHAILPPRVGRLDRLHDQARREAGRASISMRCARVYGQQLSRPRGEPAVSRPQRDQP